MASKNKVRFPGNISCFFRAYPHGSTGCGITTDKGVITELKDGKGVFINGAGEENTTSHIVMERMGVEDVEVRQTTEIPIGYGFGSSGSAALGLSVALNNYKELGKSFEECVKIAHDSEVESKTGLGDVIGIANRDGIGLKTRPGLEGLQKENRVAIECPDWAVCGLFGGALETRNILKNTEIMARVNVIGERCMHELRHKPSLENLTRLSRFFTKETGLWNAQIRNAMKRIPSSSMIMLGNGIYSVTSEPEKVEEEMSTFTERVIVCKIIKDARGQ